ncbi:hypothetical protein ARMSODRAFT_953028 [Armillaria solidipes]|uniref:Uncharacterized protein n=1 Tax=Armillaria solidipes TaxID=1076256 RepID=A0A2H3BUJ4_9AGAR|nr:hypothetical protein ARMSODRAFT_953028 [Armillaria solidipes]
MSTHTFHDDGASDASARSVLRMNLVPFLGCGTDSTIVRRPRRFISDITAVTQEITHLWSSPCPPLEQLWFLLRVSYIEGLTAKFIYDTLSIYNDEQCM